MSNEKVTFGGQSDGSESGPDGSGRLYLPADVDVANDEWGASCGPAAFAAMRRCPVQATRVLFPAFPGRPWVNLTTMREAFDAALLDNYAVTFDRWPRADELGLLQIQIDGPWNMIGVPPQAALKHTHWVAVDGDDWIYDVNNAEAWLTRAQWVEGIVPLLLQAHRRSTGALPRRGLYFIRGTRAAKHAQNYDA